MREDEPMSEEALPGIAPILGVRFAVGSPIDAFLSALAEHLRARGLRVAGHVQMRVAPQGNRERSEMRLLDLASGRALPISENRGAGAGGCQLDSRALSAVAQELEQMLPGAADILIVNRFGRSEAEGRGLRGAIEKALHAGIPVIIAYRDAYAEGWHAFHGGLARDCAPDTGAVLAALGLAE